MRISKMFLVSFIGLLFIIGVTYKPQQRQEQEATPEDLVGFTEDHVKVFDVVHKISNPQFESVADILWMKKAAKLALEKGMPNFNVLYQNVTKSYDAGLKRDVTVVEGAVELTADPMGGEYNANEIKNLFIPGIVER